jgi:hypothetical protein
VLNNVDRSRLCRNSKDLESEFGRRLAIDGNDEIRSITGYIVPTSASATLLGPWDSTVRTCNLAAETRSRDGKSCLFQIVVL